MSKSVREPKALPTAKSNPVEIRDEFQTFVDRAARDSRRGARRTNWPLDTETFRILSQIARPIATRLNLTPQEAQGVALSAIVMQAHAKARRESQQ